ERTRGDGRAGAVRVVVPRQRETRADVGRALVGGDERTRAGVVQLRRVDGDAFEKARLLRRGAGVETEVDRARRRSAARILGECDVTEVAEQHRPRPDLRVEAS